MARYAVVEFTEDSSVDVVPCCWLEDDDKCYWPPYRNERLVNAIRKCDERQELWTPCDVRVLRKCETYSAARSKLRRAEETSALETDHDDDAGRPRRQKRRALSSSESESSPEKNHKKKPAKVEIPPKKSRALLPMPCIPPALCIELESPVADVRLCNGSSVARSSSPRKRSETALSGNLDWVNVGLSSGSSVTRKSPRKTPETALSRNHDVANVGLCSGSSVTRKSPRKRPETALTGNLDAADVGLCSSSSVTRTSPVAVGLKRRLGFSTREDVESVSLSTVWSKLSVIETQQRQQTRLLQTVLAALQSSGVTDGSLELPNGIVLPAKSLQDLLDIEKLLENGEILRKMVHYLGAIGGKDVAETTRRIMKSLMTNGVARRMNFAGRGSKTGISEMKVLDVVIGSVRRNRLLKKVTRAEVEMVVKLWLRYAIDRSGGRNVRTGSVRRAAKRSSCGDQVDSDSD